MQIKKFRQEHNAFLVQGSKNILELLGSSMEILDLFISDELSKQESLLSFIDSIDYSIIKRSEIEKHSTFRSNSDGIAVVKMPIQKTLKAENDFVLVLDGIADPGNLGTIIRIADWYGITKIVCSNSCVDWYNPKVINSTMGSFTRVKPFYTDLKEYFEQNESSVIGAVMNGQNIHDVRLPKSGYLVIGSESHGISNELLSTVTYPVTIPKFGGAESLNAGIAAAVICDNLMRSS